MDFKSILSYSIINTTRFKFSVVDLLFVVGTLLISYLLIAIIRKTLTGKNARFQRNNRDTGHAIFLILKYIIIVATIIIILESVGVKVTLLLAGSAALLVGLGLGIQQLFNDIVSGFILLFERTITIEDIIEVDGMVARVKKIGLRTSEVETRDDIIIIVPNSRLVSEKVINWSHNRAFTRFKIKVGVAYGSDVELVRTILKECVEANENVSKEKEPNVRFVDFGDSSLDFVVLFWSDKMFRIDDAKSDIRFMINEKFKENGIRIPFPQRDLHIISNATNLNLDTNPKEQ